MSEVASPSAGNVDELAHLSCVEFSRLLIRSSRSEGTLVEQDGVLLCASSVDFPVLFNIAWRTDPNTDATDMVAQADTWFHARGRGWSMMVRDGPVDDDLRAAAEAAGLVAVLDSPEMVITTPPDARTSPSGIELRWVTDVQGMADFVSVNDAAYTALGLPAGTVREGLTSLSACTAANVHSVVAYDNDTPVAAAQLLMSHTIGGVYWVGTIPGAARRGLGGLVTAAVSRRGFDQGARFVSLQASPMGEPIYRGMGFVERYRYATWARLEP